MSDKPRTEGQPIHALPMPPYDFQGNTTPTDNLEAGAGDLVERLRSAARKVRALKEWFTLAGAAKTTLHRLAETSDQAAAQLAAVTAENARLREYYEAREDLRKTGLFYATEDQMVREEKARAALSQEAPK